MRAKTRPSAPVLIVIKICLPKGRGLIDVDKAHKEAFISIYQSYKKDMSSVRTIKPSVTGDSEEAIEAKIRCDFVKSEKILEIRKNYYEQFRTILRPSQIQKMYDIEREWGRP